MAVSLLDRSGQFSSAASNFRILRVLEAKNVQLLAAEFHFLKFRSHILGFGAIFGSFFGKSSDAFLMWNSGIFRITRLVKARDSIVKATRGFDLLDLDGRLREKKGFVRNRWDDMRLLETKRMESHCNEVLRSLSLVRFIGALRTLVHSIADTLKPLVWALLLWLGVLKVSGPYIIASGIF